MINSSPDGYLELPLDQTLSDTGKLMTASWWERKSIRFKTTVLAIAIGTIPTLAVGSTVYYVGAKSIKQETTNLRKTLVADLQNQVNIFMSDRFGDIKVMANLDIFTDPQLSKIATTQQKSAALQKFQNARGIYNNIAVFDAQGDLIAQTEGKTLSNHLNRGYIQDALKANGAVISQPVISTSSGIYSIYTASPIKDSISGKTIGFVRARMPVAVLKDLLKEYTAGGNQYYLLSDRGEIFLGSAGEYVIKTRSDNSTVDNKSFDYEAIKAVEVFSGTESLLGSGKVSAGQAVNTTTKKEQFLTYAPPKSFPELPDLNWQAIVAADNSLVFAPQTKLRQVFILGIGVIALGVGTIAYALANRLLRPILLAANAVKEIGGGNLNTRLEIRGADEISQLSANINGMATQLSNLVETQALLAQQSEAIKNATIQFANVSNKSEILSIAVEEVHKSLPANRIVYYQFANNRSGMVVAESASKGSSSLQNTEILNPDLVAAYLTRHQQGKTQVEVVKDIQQANIAPSYRKQIQSLGIKASLIAPVIMEDELDGLLMVHQASKRNWLEEEVEFVSQIANQIAFGITRLKLTEQQKQGEIREKAAKEVIQSRALDLLKEVYEVSEGDLTVRAKVTEDEIGTIADSYNATIESLQKLVNQTKAAALEVKNNTSANDVAIQALVEKTLTQAEAISKTLEQVNAMEESIAQVAQSASEADEFVKQANLTIRTGDRAMNHSVAEINAVQNTVTETAIKVQQLGESSQEISQAVNLVGRFAAQTHLLALKASIEAARAGEQGKGFAVIANEVRSLATQSAEATAEIETLVTKIQLETNELAEAMNKGTEQIAAGSELVQQTRQSLTQISEASDEISKLVGSITQATKQQSETSTRVSQTMVSVAEIAENNSQAATQVSISIKELSSVAEKLQSGIGKFKT
ncbi:HAMP domain-containing protein [Waterburya agarophytonicola K14]|uniref:HAMP domain-containing protein n=1 Tax=Waterburya agarophytonicola KI4 TaxID=2874699 RepID=A0A964FF53_9CYAN|nr:methyl-accepting chemotaxis protein [Waterburya agarophytonicola]MCC0176652.1 HAMP domain-containing protein [Waterburya agarophytonicola KI4]